MLPQWRAKHLDEARAVALTALSGIAFCDSAVDDDESESHGDHDSLQK